MMEDAMLIWRLDKALKDVFIKYMLVLMMKMLPAYVQEIANNFKRTNY